MPIGHIAIPSSFRIEIPSKLSLDGGSSTNFDPVLFLLDGLLVFEAFEPLDSIDTESEFSFSRALAAALRAWLIGLMRLENKVAIGRILAAIIFRFWPTLNRC